MERTALWAAAILCCVIQEVTVQLQVLQRLVINVQLVIIVLLVLQYQILQMESQDRSVLLDHIVLLVLQLLFDVQWVHLVLDQEFLM
jgi:hypothetical protein